MTTETTPPERTLKQATDEFVNAVIDPTAWKQAEKDKRHAKSILMTIRTFHEGAFWVVSRVFEELEKEGYFEKNPEPTELGSLLIATLEEHDRMKKIVEGGQQELH